MQRSLVYAGIALLFWLGAGSVAAQTLPPHIQAELPYATLRGSGSFRWFGLLIYEATLYDKADKRDTNASNENGLALDLHYARALDGKKIAAASIEQIERLGRGSATQRQRWLEQMRALFPDVESGTHLTGIFVPGTAARFYRDGTWLGEIRDAAFADAFFAIWLAPNTSAPALRTQLLTSKPTVTTSQRP
ncbi:MULTISPECIES: chalcone isomerase family protein [unclassified Undibacterium]|uniref:chalcone isomerase family protein n=1 Tax=unclassified Undibacterium TaxID=2630295 RepID=UPI002AC89F11|nr:MULTISPECIES: chalcone isomerase family protein [unclassified Undibacterium]MEB0138998.1 chalcone isomerase family protein [Undibacterium sp. CCC2.1]MEB0171907.1 chalcone isomerase family protein [Undibacterium sp. CCC1.1]MEB0175848.1 chalcone isomerase family protein [Undibacterium sp. CCC3.4]MEB0215086.1 chalcone isomerase family protein [Undibacterium sp. 5I2]WPX45056.1 chalcone isomerase family protein [Undibacterium sp. CCC3.4]